MNSGETRFSPQQWRKWARKLARELRLSERPQGRALLSALLGPSAGTRALMPQPSPPPGDPRSTLFEGQNLSGHSGVQAPTCPPVLWQSTPSAAHLGGPGP